MKTHADVTWTAFRVFTIALFATGLAHGESEDEEYQSERSEAIAKKLRTDIPAELQKLGAHDWAGEYYSGDGLGVNWRLMLAPSAGYLFEWRGCLGLYDRNYGTVVVANEKPCETITFKSTRVGYKGSAPEKVLIRWGERRYLVAADDVVGFCNQVNQGREPRANVHGATFMRSGDERKKVEGLPELPEQYRDYLLKAPVTASIVEIGQTASRPSVIDDKFYGTQVTLDAGSDQGLKVGMELLVIKPEVVLLDSARITEVNKQRSIAVMNRFGNLGESPKVGWRLSTKR